MITKEDEARLQEERYSEWHASIFRFADLIAKQYGEGVEPKELGMSHGFWMVWEFKFPCPPRRSLVVRVHLYGAEETRVSVVTRFHDWTVGIAKNPRDLFEPKLIESVLARLPHHPPQKAA